MVFQCVTVLGVEHRRTRRVHGAEIHSWAGQLCSVKAANTLVYGKVY